MAIRVSLYFAIAEFVAIARLTPAPSLAGYSFVEGGCIKDLELLNFTHKSIAECALLCDSEPNCNAFNYGAATHYGHHGGPNPHDCILQGSADYKGCHGAYWAMDLYVKKENNANIAGYSFVKRGCIEDHELLTFTHKSAIECATLCDSKPQCNAFNYGAATHYGHHGGPNPHDCVLQGSAHYKGCHGAYYAMDLFVKREKETSLAGYSFVKGGCIEDHELLTFTHKSVAECAMLCDSKPNCNAFNYGAATHYGHHGGPNPHDCILQGTADYKGCHGAYWDMDLYVKPTNGSVVQKFEFQNVHQQPNWKRPVRGFATTIASVVAVFAVAGIVIRFWRSSSHHELPQTETLMQQGGAGDLL